MSLNHTRVMLIRTTGMTDTYWGKIWKLSSANIRKARIGISWKDHPTPPDISPRKALGRNAGSKASLKASYCGSLASIAANLAESCPQDSVASAMRWLTSAMSRPTAGSPLDPPEAP